MVLFIILMNIKLLFNYCSCQNNLREIANTLGNTMNPEVQCRDWRLRDKKIALPRYLESVGNRNFHRTALRMERLGCQPINWLSQGSHVNVANSRASRRSDVADTRLMYLKHRHDAIYTRHVISRALFIRSKLLTM